MSSKYKAEYETSIKARRIVKDLVQTRMPKGQNFDQVHPCPHEGQILNGLSRVAINLSWPTCSVSPMDDVPMTRSAPNYTEGLAAGVGLLEGI